MPTSITVVVTAKPEVRTVSTIQSKVVPADTIKVEANKTNVFIKGPKGDTGDTGQGIPGIQGLPGPTGPAYTGNDLPDMTLVFDNGLI